MQPTVGEIIEGKVTGITKFGAFVSLPDGKNGLVHISEIANTYVNDVHEHVSEGQTVKVKVIGVNEAGKINLSMKQAESRPAQQQRGTDPAERRSAPKPASQDRRSPAPAPLGEATFEDKLKQFMQDSDSRMSGSKMYTDKKSGYRRRRD